MPGTDTASAAIGLRACWAVPGTDIAYGEARMNFWRSSRPNLGTAGLWAYAGCSGTMLGVRYWDRMYGARAAIRAYGTEAGYGAKLLGYVPRAVVCGTEVRYGARTYAVLRYGMVLGLLSEVILEPTKKNLLALADAVQNTVEVSVHSPDTWPHTPDTRMPVCSMREDEYANDA
eukprot:2522310-Rhodomonas_salina.1